MMYYLSDIADKGILNIIYKYGKGKMNINLFEFLGRRNIGDFRKLFKIIKQSETYESNVEQLETWIVESIPLIKEHMKEIQVLANECLNKKDKAAEDVKAKQLEVNRVQKHVDMLKAEKDYYQKLKGKKSVEYKEYSERLKHSNKMLKDFKDYLKHAKARERGVLSDIRRYSKEYTDCRRNIEFYEKCYKELTEVK